MTSASTSSRTRQKIENLVFREGFGAGLFPHGARIVVGVSGGPDSTALLLILQRLSTKRSLHLTAAYFNHQLRGAEAASREKRALTELTRAAGVELVCGAGNVRALARSGHQSLEEAARQARYAFLGQTAREAGAGLIAVGHTRDDQAETVLMHILRGSGLAGLSGMMARGPLPVSGFENIDLVRPLLHLGRFETLSYCRTAGIEPVEDESNQSTAYVRNRVRNELMPMLRTYNPDVAGALGRLAEAARSDRDFIQSAAGELVLRQGEAALLDCDLLRGAHSALRREAVRAAVRALLGEVQDFDERHWRALDAAISGPDGIHLDLPRSLVADVLSSTLRLGSRESQGPPATLGGPTLLPVPGVADRGAWRFAAGPDALPNSLASVEVGAAAAGESITVRARNPGDRIEPLGLRGTKKLQDLFTDAHVPRSQRDSVPVFENNRGIIWVGGFRIAEWAKCQPGEARLCLSYARVGQEPG